MNPIESYEVKEEVSLVYEISYDFAQDIPASFLRLAERLKNNGQERECYGIVLKEKGEMQYRATYTELYSGEGSALGIPTMVIPKGRYESIQMEDWSQKLMQIGPTFDQILKSGKVDIESPCIEYYKTKRELICMVKSNDI